MILEFGLQFLDGARHEYRSEESGKFAVGAALGLWLPLLMLLSWRENKSLGERVWGVRELGIPTQLAHLSNSHVQTCALSTFT